MKILITGSTGFIGKRLVPHLLKEGHELFLLVRRGSLLKAQELFSHHERLQLVVGDLTNNDVIDNVSSAHVLGSGIEKVIHLAASYDLEAKMTDAYITNVVGTQNLLYLLHKLQGLKEFHYMSTYAVSGGFDGVFSEDTLDSAGEFTDHYARTKMQAELLVRSSTPKSVKLRIYRPGIVVGDSVTGEMDKIDGPYYFFRFFKDLKRYSQSIPIPFLPISYNEAATLPFIPVDTLVSWLGEMMSHPTSELAKTYHLMPSEKISIEHFLKESFRAFGIHTRIQRVPFPKLYSRILPLVKIPTQVGPYMESKTRYSLKNMKSDYPHLKAPLMKKYLPVLIEAYNQKHL